MTRRRHSVADRVVVFAGQTPDALAARVSFGGCANTDLLPINILVSTLALKYSKPARILRSVINEAGTFGITNFDFRPSHCVFCRL